MVVVPQVQVQALSKIAPPLEQLENNKMLLKVRLHRAILDHKSPKSSKSSLKKRKYYG